MPCAGLPPGAWFVSLAEQGQSVMDKLIPAAPGNVAACQLAVHPDIAPTNIKCLYLLGCDLLKHLPNQVNSSLSLWYS